MTSRQTIAETIVTDVPYPINTRHHVVDGDTWQVSWKQGGFQVKRKVSDHDLSNLCEWASRYADNATLIVTPLP